MSSFVLGLILGGSVVVVGFVLGCLFLGERHPNVLDRLLAKDRALAAVDDYRATTVPRPRAAHLTTPCVRVSDGRGGFGALCPLHHVDHSREGTS